MGFFDRLRRRNDVSAGGSQIYRHKHAAKPELAHGDQELIETIGAHIAEHLGEPERVLHQIVSVYVHVDIHMVLPSDERPWITLVTSGMSQRPMKAPRELGPEVTRAELMLALPPDWPTDDESLADERHYWPFRILQMLATLPHEFDTWLWVDHTIPNGDPPEPYAEGTGLCCAMLIPPETAAEDFIQMRHGDDVVTFLGICPLYEDEMRLKLEAGAEELARRLDEAGVTELIDPTRRSVATS
jgi:hypothetical protein